MRFLAIAAFVAAAFAANIAYADDAQIQQQQMSNLSYLGQVVNNLSQVWSSYNNPPIR